MMKWLLVVLAYGVMLCNGQICVNFQLFTLDASLGAECGGGVTTPTMRIAVNGLPQLCEFSLVGDAVVDCTVIICDENTVGVTSLHGF